MLYLFRRLAFGLALLPFFASATRCKPQATAT